MSIKALVFDVGNVLFKYDPKDVVQKLLPGSIHQSLYLTHLFDDVIWQSLDRGDITQSDAIQFLTQKLGEEHRENLQTCLTEFSDHLQPMSESLSCFEHFSKSIPIYLLSNYQDEPFARLEALHPILSKATGKIISARVKVKKPEAKIFWALLEEFTLNPEEILFIDDLEENCKAAEKLGISSLLFTEKLNLRYEIESRI